MEAAKIVANKTYKEVKSHVDQSKKDDKTSTVPYIGSKFTHDILGILVILLFVVLYLRLYSNVTPEHKQWIKDDFSISTIADIFSDLINQESEADATMYFLCFARLCVMMLLYRELSECSTKKAVAAALKYYLATILIESGDYHPRCIILSFIALLAHRLYSVKSQRGLPSLVLTLVCVDVFVVSEFAMLHDGIFDFCITALEILVHWASLVLLSLLYVFNFTNKHKTDFLRYDPAIVTGVVFGVGAMMTPYIYAMIILPKINEAPETESQFEDAIDY